MNRATTMTRIMLDDKIILFKCDKKKGCNGCADGECEHTADIKHAVFDGEKSFTQIGSGAYFEKVQQEQIHEEGSVETKN